MITEEEIKKKAEEISQKYYKSDNSQHCELQTLMAASEMAYWMKKQYDKLFENSYEGIVDWYDGLYIDYDYHNTEEEILINTKAKVGDKFKVILIKE